MHFMAANESDGEKRIPQECCFEHVLKETTHNIEVLIGLVGRVFAYGPGDLGSIPGRVIPKTFKMVLDTSLLSAQHYMVRIKGKVE